MLRQGFRDGVSLAFVAIGKRTYAQTARALMQVSAGLPPRLDRSWDYAVRGECGAFLPANQVRDVVVRPCRWVHQVRLVACTGQSLFLSEVGDPRAEVVGDMAPGNVNGGESLSGPG